MREDASLCWRFPVVLASIIFPLLHFCFSIALLLCVVVLSFLSLCVCVCVCVSHDLCVQVYATESRRRRRCAERFLDPFLALRPLLRLLHSRQADLFQANKHAPSSFLVVTVCDRGRLRTFAWACLVTSSLDRLHRTWLLNSVLRLLFALLCRPRPLLVRECLLSTSLFPRHVVAMHANKNPRSKASRLFRHGHVPAGVTVAMRSQRTTVLLLGYFCLFLLPRISRPRARVVVPFFFFSPASNLSATSPFCPLFPIAFPFSLWLLCLLFSCRLTDCLDDDSVAGFSTRSEEHGEAQRWLASRSDLFQRLLLVCPPHPLTPTHTLTHTLSLFAFSRLLIRFWHDMPSAEY